MVEYIFKRSKNNIKIKSALGDGSYNSNNNFEFLQEKDSTGHQSKKEFHHIVQKQ
jgi:hypothetical protein